MSGINISYDRTTKIGSAEGESNFLDKPEESSLADVIAGEVINEILENALDIATRASETGFKWDEPTNNLISERTIGDIVTPTLDEIMEGLNSISVNKQTHQDSEPLSLENEMKKLLCEMMSPPCEIVNYESRKGGIGDQPHSESFGRNEPEEPVCEMDKSKPVEKKSRVTDLVKNSPDLINKYLMNETTRQTQGEWEEGEEQFLQVIELDCVKPGEEPFKAHKKHNPEEYELPEEDEGELISNPKDDVMDLVDLSGEAFLSEERQLCAGHVDGGKGDEYDKFDMVVVMPPNEITGAEQMVGRGVTAEPKSNASLNSEKKKKKGNFATRFFGFLKKHPKATTAPTQEN